MKIQAILFALLLTLLAVTGCESNASSANVAARRYHACVAIWTASHHGWHRTFNQDVHEACLHVSGVVHKHEDKTE